MVEIMYTESRKLSSLIHEYRNNNVLHQIIKSCHFYYVSTETCLLLLCCSHSWVLWEQSSINKLTLFFSESLC